MKIDSTAQIIIACSFLALAFFTADILDSYVGTDYEACLEVCVNEYSYAQDDLSMECIKDCNAHAVLLKAGCVY